MAWAVAGVVLLATAGAVAPLARQRWHAEARMEEARAELGSARARSDRLGSRYERTIAAKDADLVDFEECFTAMNEQVDRHNAVVEDMNRIGFLGPEQAARFVKRFRDLKFTARTELINCRLAGEP